MLQPGEVLLLDIPQQMRRRNVSAVVLCHRQDAASDRGLDPDSGRDLVPGTTAVNLHSTDDATWRTWNCPWGSQGKWGAEFAERYPVYLVAARIGLKELVR